MNRRRAKQEILLLLDQVSPDDICKKLVHYPQHIVINALFIALCNQQERIKWSAVVCFGRIVPEIAEKDPESSRIIMRRFLWSLNDESGGIGWGAPEAMAEIMCYSSMLRHEYLHMLMSYMKEDGEEAFQDGNFIEHPLLQRGLLWGVGRVCLDYPDIVLEHQVRHSLIEYLKAADPYVAGLAIWCIGLLQLTIPIETVDKYLVSSLELNIFINGKVQTFKVSKLAKMVLDTKARN